MLSYITGITLLIFCFIGVFVNMQWIERYIVDNKTWWYIVLIKTFLYLFFTSWVVYLERRHIVLPLIFALAANGLVVGSFFHCSFFTELRRLLSK